ncbi:hypothetical protein ES708_25393 [subsurface metagenome]
MPIINMIENILLILSFLILGGILFVGAILVYGFWGFR